eukprot:TRINITY_DN42231_c0_g2_i1.p1 TRINITY_DN42231_c0_g2~~TRINITY_DN42231_c0_g2_i1.p1  ORF type:complete len:310 (-),score=53.14 TRINITY_DN42231_c0_g2_i1:43-972(-)
MGCGVSYSAPDAHQPQGALTSRPSPSTPHATVVQPRHLPQAVEQQVPGGGTSGNTQSDVHMTAPVVKSLVNLDRSSLEWSSDSGGGESFLSFRLDTAGDECDVSVHFLVRDEDTTEGKLPNLCGARTLRQEKFSKGLKQSCKVGIERGLELQDDLKSFGAEKDGYYHLVIDLALQTNDQSVVSRQLSYAKLTQSEDRWVVNLSKQKVVCGDRVLDLQSLYGTMSRPDRPAQTSNETNNDTGAAAAAAEGAADGADCVICLTNPRDTVIVPCRHVCLCSTCAAVTSSTWSFQCPVCRARVAAMVKLGGEK